MNVREWALVAFTLLLQTSVGVLLVAAVFHSFVSRGSMHGSVRALELPVLVAAGVAVLGLVASLAHLGHPAQAWLALTNARASWLSREIVLAVLFTASTAVTAAAFPTGIGSPALRRFLTIAAAVFGVAAIYAMSRLYMVPAQPAWNRMVTPLTFFATSVLLGAVVVIAISPGTLRSAPGTTSVWLVQNRALVSLAIGLLALQLLLLPLQIAAFAGEPAAAVSTAAIGHTATWLAASRTIVALAATILLAGILRGRPPSAMSPAVVRGAALALVALSEILGRVIFYASSVRL